LGKLKGTRNLLTKDLSILQRIERYITKQEDGHWLWSGGFQKIPLFTYRDDTGELVRVSVRRLMLETYKKVEVTSRQVRNTCGLERCVSPDCSELKDKGRKLTELNRQKEEGKILRDDFIRKSKDFGFSQRNISKVLNLHESEVSLIIRGKRRKLAA
jgi:hypothetical protein